MAGWAVDITLRDPNDQPDCMVSHLEAPASVAAVAAFEAAMTASTVEVASAAAGVASEEAAAVVSAVTAAGSPTAELRTAHQQVHDKAVSEAVDPTIPTTAAVAMLISSHFHQEQEATAIATGTWILTEVKNAPTRAATMSRGRDVATKLRCARAEW